MSERYIYKQIQDSLGDGKAIIIYGARQVGKTTVAEKLLSRYPSESILKINGESEKFDEKIQNKSIDKLRMILKDIKVLFIDEAQYIENIGITIKLIVDNIKSVQVIATGSSAFELKSKITEPMTGRASIFKMYPMSLQEIASERHLQNHQFDELLQELLIYGGYPTISTAPTLSKDESLSRLKDDYLYKDILSFDRIYKSSLIDDLLMALAYQLGNEVNFTELSRLLKIDSQTVQKYIDILEQSFIVFSLKPLSRYPRREINKTRKIYFYDNGIRNALVNNFNRFDTRADKGALFENYMISERIKFNAKYKKFPNKYFWRTYDGAEIDYIEETGGKIFAYEFKSYLTSPNLNKSFTENYQSINSVINPGNWQSFIL